MNTRIKLNNMNQILPIRNQILYFCLLNLLFLTPSFSQNELSILSYNTYNGFQSDTSVMDQYLEWVKDLDPDVVAYQEMNKFSQKSLEEFASEYGHDYAVLIKEEGYPVAISSKYPIVNVQKVTDNMHHGYLYANVLGTHIFIVHLSPFDHRFRAKELRLVLAHAASLSESDRVLIMGDFNAFDKKDAAYYKEDLFEAMRKRDSTYNQNNLNAGSLDYSVMDLMENAGFHDSYWEIKDTYHYSMPTPKYQTRPVRRIDYIWVNEQGKEDILDAGIIADEHTNVMSDHYPTYIILETNKE